jgi:hypothetical protein
VQWKTEFDELEMALDGRGIAEWRLQGAWSTLKPALGVLLVFLRPGVAGT